MRERYVDTRYIRIFLGILILSLTACSDNNIRPTEKATMVTLTSTFISPSTPTRTAISIPTQTETIIQTPLPTLPAAEAEAHVLELLGTNADCSLPCWWDITPGVSTIDDARSTLEPFLGAVFSENGFEYSKAGSYYFTSLPSGLRIGIDVLAEDDIVSLVYIHTVMTKDIYKSVYNDPFYQEIMSDYILKAMLAKYGKPDEVLIRSFSDLAADNNPTQILLYYPNDGIVAQYFSRNLPMLDDETVTLWTCPPQSHISLRLFNPDSHISLSQLLSIDDSYSKYKNISEATNMNIDAFFQAYHDYNEETLNSGCPIPLKTPEDIWPNEYINP